MREKVKRNYDNALDGVAGARNSNAGRAWEVFIESVVEVLKEDLITAKPEKALEIQGAIKELRQILKVVKRTEAE